MKDLNAETRFRKLRSIYTSCAKHKRNKSARETYSETVKVHIHISYIVQAVVYKTEMDPQCIQDGKCKMVSGSPLGRQHLYHKCQDKDPDTCCEYRHG